MLTKSLNDSDDEHTIQMLNLDSSFRFYLFRFSLFTKQNLNFKSNRESNWEPKGEPKNYRSFAESFSIDSICLSAKMVTRWGDRSNRSVRLLFIAVQVLFRCCSNSIRILFKVCKSILLKFISEFQLLLFFDCPSKLAIPKLWFEANHQLSPDWQNE